MPALADGRGAPGAGRRRNRAGRLPAGAGRGIRCTDCAFSGVCRKDYVGDE